MDNGKHFLRHAILTGLLLFGFSAFPSSSPAEISSGDVEVLRKSIEVLQKQIQIQGEEIASLKNQFQEKAQAGTVYLPPQEKPPFLSEGISQILLSEKQPEKPDEKQLVTLYDDGFLLKGRDDTIRIGGWYQGDLDLYEKGHPGNSRFRNRRIRLDIRGVLENDFGYRLYTDFSGSGGSIQEAWLEYKRFPALRLKAGQYIVPFSLDANYSARWIDFVERPVGVANFQPAEDLGAMIYGTPWGGRIDYALGVFNGRPRLSDDNNDAFDLAGRLVFAPFRKSPSVFFKDLYFGGSLTSGSSQETLGGTSFTTTGGTPFFTYAPGVRHTDNRTRLGGELQWIYGPGDLKAEYVGAFFNDVQLGETKTEVHANSWYVSGTYVLTGEHKERNKPIRPKRNFDPVEGGWGAWEVAARFEQLFINESPFLLGYATGADRLDALSFGLNWWPNVHTRLMIDYVFQNLSNDVAARGEALDDENLVLLRTQYDF